MPAAPRAVGKLGVGDCFYLCLFLNVAFGFVLECVFGLLFRIYGHFLHQASEVHQTYAVTVLPVWQLVVAESSAKLCHPTPVTSSETRRAPGTGRNCARVCPWVSGYAWTVRRVAAHGNWQDAVADVPAALDSFTVAETTDEAATWAAMGCV